MSKKFLLLVFTAVGLNVLYILCFNLLPSLPATLSSILLTVIFLTVDYFLIFRNPENKGERGFLADVKSFYQSAEKLLNAFFSYFDNSFLLIYNIFEKIRNNNNIPEEGKNYIQNLYEKNKIDKYLEDVKQDTLDTNRSGIFELRKKIGDFIYHSNNLVAMTNSIEPLLFDNTFKHIDTIIKKESFNRLVVEYEYYSDIIYNMLLSIRNNISSTSKPLSNEISSIKDYISVFVRKTKSWKEEIINERSGKNIQSIISEYESQKQNFNKIVNKINGNYENIKNNLANIGAKVEGISKNIIEIDNIAEMVKLLALNASIEAARTGKHGKGFRVIATEIKALSDATQTFSEKIITETKEAQADVVKNSSNLNEESKNISQEINAQKDNFNSLYKMLENYYNNFHMIFYSLTVLIDEITKHIDNISPVFQLHEISIQEMENLNLIIEKFLEDNSGEISAILKSTPENIKYKILESLIVMVKDMSSTENELNVMQKLINKYGFTEKIKISRVSHKVELF